MKNATIGEWLIGLTISEIITLLISLSVTGSDAQVFEMLVGVIVIVQIVFAVMGGLRLQKTVNADN